MGKLHEVLMVAPDLVKTAVTANEKAINTMVKEPTHFLGSEKTVEYFDDHDAHLNTTETTALTLRVFDVLKGLVGPNSRAWDIVLQKEAANQKAVADIEIDGQTLAQHVPATVLLTMETKLQELRKVYLAIPTLAPGIDWVPDATRGAGTWKANKELENLRTKKTVRPILMHPATEHHPAQVSAINEDMPVAKTQEKRWSAMLTEAQKTELLNRLEQLTSAVKTARQRANNQDVENRQFGKQLFDFLHKGIVV